MLHQCFIAVLVLGTVCVSLEGAEQPNPADFDTAPKDGRLNQLERARFLVRKLNPPVNDIDTDGDGIPSQKEILKWASDRDPEIGSALRIDPTKTPPTVQQMEAVYPAEPKKNEHSYYSLKLRRSLDQIGTPFDDESETLAQAEAALFTYTRDIQNGGDIWSAVGVIARPFNLAEKQIPLFGGAAIDRLDFVPSVAFDRNTGGKDVEETDALTFRAQLVSWIQGGLFDLMELSGDVRVDTHFGFEKSRPGRRGGLEAGAAYAHQHQWWVQVYYPEFSALSNGAATACRIWRAARFCDKRGHRKLFSLGSQGRDHAAPQSGFSTSVRTDDCSSQLPPSLGRGQYRIDIIV